MRRDQLEHIIRAATGITGTKEFVIVGSQSILGQHPNAPEELLISMEADIFSLRNPEDSDLVDGTIGEASPFHQTFGYYAHGVAQDTALLPSGWKDRVFPIRNENTGGGVGLCLEVHDLAVSKLVAAREKDMSFIFHLLKYQLISFDVLRARIALMPIQPGDRARCEARLTRLFNSEWRTQSANKAVGLQSLN